MEYSINKLAKLAGVSTRTLRYYDEIGLLKPKRISSNSYRVYGENEVNLLQQIMFYRETGMPLDEIKNIILSKSFNSKLALENHLASLISKREQLDILIGSVEKTISYMEGKEMMSDKEKFEGFKQKMLNENEKNYGKEIREKYGENVVNASNKKVENMSKEQYEKAEQLAQEVNDTLKLAFENGDPKSEIAQKVCALHKEWLCVYWDKYSKEAHKNLAQMYVDDERFTAYYDKIAIGCAVFLRDAINIFCQ